MVFPLIYLCVQIVHLPVTRIDLPPSACWSRNSHWCRCSFCPPTPQRFSRCHLHHDYRCGRYRGQHLTIDIHRKAQEGLEIWGNCNHRSHLDLLEDLLLLLHCHKLGFRHCHLRFLCRSRSRLLAYLPRPHHVLAIAPIILLVAKKYHTKTPPYELVILGVCHPLAFWFFLPNHSPSLSPVACPGLHGRCQIQDSCEPRYPLEKLYKAWFRGACPLTCCVSLGVYIPRFKVVHRPVLPPPYWR